MRYAVLGACHQGLAIAYDLARCGEARSITLVDADRERLAVGVERLRRLAKGLEVVPVEARLEGEEEHGERIVQVRTQDGLTLEGKLSLPPHAPGLVPVVFFLGGAGPWTFDRPLVYPDLEQLKEFVPPSKVYLYCDFYAQELVRRGLGFFRINKRGCGIGRDDQGQPREISNRTIFSKATCQVLLADYQAALQTLRRRPGIDPNHIVLLGASEGSRLAPRLALRAPEGIAAVGMFRYSEDGTKNTILWQHTVGPWRGLPRQWR